MKLILKYLSKYWYIAIFAPIFMVGEVFMDMLISQYMQKMVDFGIQTNNLDNVLKYGIMMIVALILGVSTGILSGVFTNLTAYKFSNCLRKDLYNKILCLTSDEINEFKTGSLITRVTNDVTQVQNMLSMALRGLIRSLGLFVLGIIFLLRISTKFTTILIILLPVEVVLLIIFLVFILPIFKKIQEKIDHINSVVHENVSGSRVVKAFTKEEYETNRFESANIDFTKQNLKLAGILALAMPILTLLLYAVQIIIYYMGGTSVIEFEKGLIPEGEMLMVGEITQSITYIMMISSSLLMLGMMFANIARGFASASRIAAVLNSKIDILDGSFDIENSAKHGYISLKNVNFKYHGAKQNTLKNINLDIKQGETIAIVGSTGCGKTTLVELMLRFYDVNSGKILLNDVNIKDYKLKDLHNKITICLQKPELFEGTIKHNIKYANINATDEEIEKVAKIAQAHDFIIEKPNQYEENVGEKGSNLSGGQKQRVSIARALLCNPEIIIFDDSTSALDLITESKLHSALRQEYPNLTKIIVAQRIATAKNADKIVVLDKGEIKAFDTHENLMKNSPIYQGIYASQLKGDNV